MSSQDDRKGQVKDVTRNHKREFETKFVHGMTLLVLRLGMFSDQTVFGPALLVL